MALYIPQSILHLARSLYVRPETYGPTYVRTSTTWNPLGLSRPVMGLLFTSSYSEHSLICESCLRNDQYQCYLLARWVVQYSLHLCDLHR